MLTRTFSDNAVFIKRRKKLSEQTGEGVFVLFSGQEGHLATFRPKSNFVYLTGFEEPDSCAVIRTGANPSFHLFVRDKDPSIEIWDGERYGPEKAKTEFAVDVTHSMDDIDKDLPGLLRGAPKIYYSLGEDKNNDDIVVTARAQAQQLDRRSGAGQAMIADPRGPIGQLRVIKDDLEKKWIRESCELSANAHVEVMKNVKPGMNERQAQAFLFHSYYIQQAAREGYCSIIASGANATVLHYRGNNQIMKDGDFLLIDAGAEKNYFTADITRTYPVNAKFTRIQKEFYQSVLDVQKKLITAVQVGFSLHELQERACVLLTERMIELGLLSGSVTDLVAEKKYHKYYPHGVGHYLGMDVHDVGLSKVGEKPVPFEEGMVITVEPGIYVPKDDMDAPKELRGLGVRIEDDVLIGAKEPEVMTAKAPKEVNELESIVGSGTL